MPKIIDLASQKGGIQKTTVAVNLSHALALRDKKVILLDLDSQGQCASYLGFDPTSSAFNFLSGKSYELIPALDNLKLIAANSEMIKAERWDETQVAEAVNRVIELAATCDYLVIDTPPVGVRQEIGLRAAETLIVPALCESPGIVGLANVLDLAQRIGRYQQLIVVPTNFDKRWPENEYNVDVLKRQFGNAVFPPVLRRMVMAEAVAYGRTCFNYEIEARKRYMITPIRESFANLAGWVMASAEEALFES